jgi:ankyrin repeat protein
MLEGIVQQDKDFFEACARGDIDKVNLLLTDDSINVNQTQSQEKYVISPLGVACVFNHVEIVKLLLTNRRIDVNQGQYYIDNENETPQKYTIFWFACQNGMTEIVALLLTDDRIDVNQKGYYNTSPFFAACFMGHSAVIQLLLNNERIDVNQVGLRGITPFMAACSNNNHDVVTQLLANERIDVNQLADNGMTPIFVACTKNFIYIVKQLLDNERVNANIPYIDLPLFVFVCLNYPQSVMISFFLQKLFKKNPELLNKSDLTIANQLVNFYASENYFIIDSRENKIYLTVSAIEPQLPIPLTPIIVAVKQKILSAKCFLLNVTLVDDIFRIDPGNETGSKRVFKFVSKLPLDLQMVFWNRFVGSARNVIDTQIFNTAYQQFVKLDKAHVDFLNALKELITVNYSNVTHREQIPNEIIQLKSLAEDGIKGLKKIVTVGKTEDAALNITRWCKQLIDDQEKTAVAIYKITAELDIEDINSIANATVALKNLTCHILSSPADLRMSVF